MRLAARIGKHQRAHERERADDGARHEDRGEVGMEDDETSHDGTQDVARSLHRVVDPEGPSAALAVVRTDQGQRHRREPGRPETLEETHQQKQLGGDPEIHERSGDEDTDARQHGLLHPRSVGERAEQRLCHHLGEIVGGDEDPDHRQTHAHLPRVDGQVHGDDVGAK